MGDRAHFPAHVQAHLDRAWGDRAALWGEWSVSTDFYTQLGIPTVRAGVVVLAPAWVTELVDGASDLSATVASLLRALRYLDPLACAALVALGGVDALDDAAAALAYAAVRSAERP